MQDFISNFETNVNSEIVIYKDNATEISCEKTFLESVLLGCSFPLTHNELSTLPIAKKGWQMVFDHWKDKGLIF